MNHEQRGYMETNDGRKRTIIEGVTPEVEAGRFPIKRTVGEKVVVEADIFADGHDTLSAVLQYRHETTNTWSEAPMSLLVNDRWCGEFSVSEQGHYYYTLSAWIDPFHTWRHDLQRRVQSEDIAIALLLGAELIEETSLRAASADQERLRQWVTTLRGHGTPVERRSLAMDEELLILMSRYPDRHLATQYENILDVVVDRKKAGFSTWYEMFPRSCTDASADHGSFKDCESRLGYIAAMGFDVVYLPPIHPIGLTKRKGKNNSLIAGPHDPGSPWAIGAEEGGHKAINPDLGNLEDFQRFIVKAAALGMEVAIDIAFQCSPDHPYIKEHPEWFRWRPDGTVQYAENPPKKYEDIYPFNFETEEWRPLWDELKDIFLFWIKQGVKIFRVDNPHTKPFLFWEWAISDIKKAYPDVLFLSEAFSRPKIMYRLAKAGFTQSYTYFTWRNTKWEINQYLTELTQSGVREYFRPNFWPNTPDILTEYLQFGDRPAFLIRLTLAATLGSNYGVYGPAYELLENQSREPGSEEYLNSEKYEIRNWEIGRPDSLKDYMTRLNRIRHENPALQQNWNLQFYPVDNDELICYSKWSDDFADFILVVVNLDAYHTQNGWVELSLESLGLDPRQPYQLHDLLSGSRFLWHGARNYVELNPQVVPAHIFRLRRKVRTERDFEYYF